MANSTFSGAVRSESGFKTIVKKLFIERFK